MTEVLTVAGVALVVTKLVDTIRNLLDKNNDARLQGVWNLSAFGLGIVAAFALNVSGAVVEGGAETVLGTGLLIGAAASGWHEVLDRVSP